MEEWHFTGCSLTSDYYLKNSSDVYPALVGKHFNVKVNNKAVRGRSNFEIFQDSLESLTDKNCSKLFVQITEPGRETFHHSYDLLSTISSVSPIIPTKKFTNFSNIYKVLDQEYNQYRLLNRFVPILNNFANSLGKKVYFINGNLYLNNVYFNNEPINNWFSLDERLKHIIDFDYQPDNMLVNQINDIRAKLSVINPTQWILLLNTICSLQTDTATDDIHPGVESNKLYAKILINFLTNE